MKRQHAIDEFYRRGDLERLHRAIRAGHSDNLVLYGTPHDAIEYWGREQLEPVEQRHGYACECRNCRDCGPQRGPLPALAVYFAIMLAAVAAGLAAGLWATN